MEFLNSAVNEKVINWRRFMHKYPEISFKEEKTAAYIAGEIAKYEGVEIFKPAGNSIVAVLTGGKPGKVVALRADFDALPIVEEADVPFKSENVGVMHACGHDCHAAMLLGALDVLHGRRDELPGRVVFIFQHAEELLPGGAQEIVKSGILGQFGIEAFFAVHVFPDAPVGTVKISPGNMMANTDAFKINIQGRGAHGAMPETGIDTLLIGTEVVQALNFITSRYVAAFDNAVLSIGKFSAGTAPNIIPDTAVIEGTVRSMKPKTRDMIENRVKEMAKNICAAYGGTCSVDYLRGYTSVYNDDRLCREFKEVIAKTLPELNMVDMLPLMGGEDFSAYQAIAPTLFLSLGAMPASGEWYINHHPKFELNEDVLPVGTALYAVFATFMAEK